MVKERIEIDSIDISHFGTKQSQKCGLIPLKYILTEDSTYKGSHLKKRLLALGLLIYKCSICHNKGTWQMKRLVLQLDHINGISNDNRIGNLRLLCPNCHSQTKTYSGRNVKLRDSARVDD